MGVYRQLVDFCGLANMVLDTRLLIVQEGAFFYSHWWFKIHQLPMNTNQQREKQKTTMTTTTKMTTMQTTLETNEEETRKKEETRSVRLAPPVNSSFRPEMVRAIMLENSLCLDRGAPRPARELLEGKPPVVVRVELREVRPKPGEVPI